jgi:hypothetical protein
MKPSLEVIKYIKDEPRFRERRNKDRGLANLILKQHHLLEVKPEIMAYIIKEILTMDRIWRKFLAENPEYRGKDYDKRGFKAKKQLEQEHQIELGYESGYGMKIKI